MTFKSGGEIGRILSVLKENGPVGEIESEELSKRAKISNPGRARWLAVTVMTREVEGFTAKFKKGKVVYKYIEPKMSIEVTAAVATAAAGGKGGGGTVAGAGGSKSEPSRGASPRKVSHRPSPPKGNKAKFVGDQLGAIRSALDGHFNILLTGPTGTGKTFVINQVCSERGLPIVVIEGKEGLQDLDFLGAIVPVEGGDRVWVDGPVTRAMRWANEGPVVLFLDEVNRIRREFLNLLVGLMNVKTPQDLALMGIGSEVNMVTIEIPMTSEMVTCPAENLYIIGAGNFGADYASYQLDPAVRRRFSIQIEFKYLTPTQEAKLISDRVDNKLADAIVERITTIAKITREQRRLGLMPGAIDTAMALTWAQFILSSGMSVDDAGWYVWADRVCKRDGLGLVKEDDYKALLQKADGGR